MRAGRFTHKVTDCALRLEHPSAMPATHVLPDPPLLGRACAFSQLTFSSAFIVNSFASIPSGYRRSSSNPALPPPAAARRVGQGRNYLAGDNWQNCRSLDESIAPVRRLIGSVWSWFMPPAIRMRCVPLSPAQWPPPQGVRLTPLRVVLDGVSSLFAAGPPIRGTPTRKA